MPFLYSRVGTGHAWAPTIFRKVCADLRGVEDAAPLLTTSTSQPLCVRRQIRRKCRAGRSGRGPIQNDDGRILQHGASNRNTLLLAAGKACAAFADNRVVAVWQGRDKVVAAGILRGSHDLLMGHDVAANLHAATLGAAMWAALGEKSLRPPTPRLLPFNKGGFNGAPRNALWQPLGCVPASRPTGPARPGRRCRSPRQTSGCLPRPGR